MHVCSESQVFIDLVFESTQKLIKNKIWTINALDYKSWRKNFTSKEENFLCACLLDSLLYRTNEQVVASCYSIFNQLLPSLQYKYEYDIAVKFDILPLLQKKQNLVKLITVNSSVSAGKSSHVLANLLRKKLKVHQENIIPPADVKYHYDEGTSLFIFIDDFLGTGNQFKSQLEMYINPNMDKGLILYCPLIAHEKGIKKINEHFPNIIVQPVEKIKEDYCFFEKYFSDNGNTPTSCKLFYEDFLKKKGFSQDFYGYEDLGVSVVFEHSCPDNNLLAIKGEMPTTFFKLF